MSYPRTIILRHRRENLKKCSLRGLEIRQDMQFFSYPTSVLPTLDGYCMLSMSGPLLSENDAHLGLFLIDATWRYAAVMTKMVEQKATTIIYRSLPAELRTAYPRRQEDCMDPDRGLASVEALYVSYLLLGRNPNGILDQYHWKQAFLSMNAPLFESILDK